MRHAPWLTTILVLVVLAPAALAADPDRQTDPAQRDCRDCEAIVEPIAVRDGGHSSRSANDDTPAPQLPPGDRMLETTRVLEASVALMERPSETLDGPTALVRGESLAGGSITVTPRGGGMMTARQRAHREVRTLIRRLR